MMARPVLLFGLITLLGLAGCAAGSRERGSDFLAATEHSSTMLAFTPGSAVLSASDIAALRHLVPPPRPGDQVRLVTGSAEAYARAASVSRVIGVAVQPFTATWPGQTGEIVGMLEFVHPVALARACEGRGTIMPDQLWQLAPDTGRVLAPPGCSTAQDLAAMAVDPNDLFAGRSLAPAPAQPFVNAAQRYNDRNLSKPPYSQEATPFYNQSDEFSGSSVSPTTDSSAPATSGLTAANPVAAGAGSAGGSSPAS